MKTGIELIAAERQEQIEKHGRTITQDVLFNDQYQLSIAARKLSRRIVSLDGVEPPRKWDIEMWGKMIDKSYKDRLIIAGALIAAEIDRIQDELKEAEQ